MLYLEDVGIAYDTARIEYEHAPSAVGSRWWCSERASLGWRGRCGQPVQQLLPLFRRRNCHLADG